MHAAACRTLRAAHQSRVPPVYRIVACVRHRRARSFHTSLVSFQAPEAPPGDSAGEKKGDNDKPAGADSQAGSESEVADGAEGTVQSNDVSKRSGRRQDYGSGVRRTNRHTATTGLPPLVFPEWFWGNNVTCFGEPEPRARWIEVGDPEADAEIYDLIEKNFKAASNDFPIYTTSRMHYRRLLCKRIELEIVEIESFRKEVESLLKCALETKDKARELESMCEKEYPYTGMLYETSWHKNRPGRTIYSRRYCDLLLYRIGKFLISRNLKFMIYPPWYYIHDRPPWYSIHEHIYTEIYASFSGELRLPPPKINIKDANKQDIVLVCPVDGGLSYLDAVVQSAATVLEADVIRLDAEDIAQICGGYLGEDAAWRQSPTAMLGYRNSSQSEFLGSQNLVNEDEEGRHSDESDEKHSARGRSSSIRTTIAFLQSPLKVFQGQYLPKTMNLGNFPGRSVNSGGFAAQAGNPGKTWNDYKISHAMDAITTAAHVKRAQSVADGVKDQQLLKTLPASKGLIIQISGYNDLNDNPVGYNLLKSLREAVKRRWFEGKSVMIVGTHAASTGGKSEHALDTVADRSASEINFDRPRTIYVPPGCRSGRIASDRIAESRALNIRHLEHMIRELMSLMPESPWTVEIDKDLNPVAEYALGKETWGYDWVRRLAINMLGFAGRDKILDGSTLNEVLANFEYSDQVKESWAAQEEVSEAMREVSGAMQEVSDAKQEPLSKVKSRDIINAENANEKDSTVEEARKKRLDWLDKLKVKCTSYEKKLLGGVINPSDIHTTFEDVRTPPETVEALKTLTSLSLIRPDSFSYGVLASDRIPGVLLYGPPGTGKTLLARAVAKESGATMLEVSASEINNMYVGEGEKNVKALFSLAKKLAPCVVFIDEADSLFGSRGHSFQRKSHREIINQFLREWDGMANLSAFIMVATNRPFDLDEAVLRRLPRRILVDLPMEKDREAILQIHLKDEMLDESISLAELAKNTPFYSGSDLKNLSVAAALACVREENEVAAKHSGPEPYVYPPKRILRKEHFDKAMQEISASISEDMSTLREIRKFDATYGDHKGRRTKKPGIGFGGTADPGLDADAGRVRKLELNV